LSAGACPLFAKQKLQLRHSFADDKSNPLEGVKRGSLEMAIVYRIEQVTNFIHRDKGSAPVPTSLLDREKVQHATIY
jgi:hypothetical protein